MRKIKFRGYGKDEKGKHWIYGNLLDEKLIGLVAIQDEKCHVWEVDPESVGQYTGLKDSEGEEIYEGDIIKVRTQNPYWRFRRNFVVTWGTDGWLLDGDSLYSWFSLHTLEVIGNVHDNPDLLEVEHDRRD